MENLEMDFLSGEAEKHEHGPDTIDLVTNVLIYTRTSFLAIKAYRSFLTKEYPIFSIFRESIILPTEGFSWLNVGGANPNSIALWM